MINIKVKIIAAAAMAGLACAVLALTSTALAAGVPVVPLVPPGTVRAAIPPPDIGLPAVVPGTSVPRSTIFLPAAADQQAGDNALYGISCTSTQCLAVGSRAEKSALNFRPLAEQWNGVGWKAVRLPGP